MHFDQNFTVRSYNLQVLGLAKVRYVKICSSESFYKSTTFVCKEKSYNFLVRSYFCYYFGT